MNTVLYLFVTQLMILIKMQDNGLINIALNSDGSKSQMQITQ